MSMQDIALSRRLMAKLDAEKGVPADHNPLLPRQPKAPGAEAAAEKAPAASAAEGKEGSEPPAAGGAEAAPKPEEGAGEGADAAKEEGKEATPAAEGEKKGSAAPMATDEGVGALGFMSVYGRGLGSERDGCSCLLSIRVS